MTLNDSSRLPSPDAATEPGGRIFVAGLMVFVAMAVGVAVVVPVPSGQYVAYGQYTIDGIRWISIAMVACLTAVCWRSRQDIKPWMVPLLLAAAMFLALWYSLVKQSEIAKVALLVCAALTVLAMVKRPLLRHAAMACLLVLFAAISLVTIHGARHLQRTLVYADGHYRGDLSTGVGDIDVLIFQECAGDALRAGHNPYAMRFPNVYTPDTPYYGPGVVDATGRRLTYGFPYPPLSLLMVLPGYATGDIRYADVMALVGAVGLMWLAGPRPVTALAVGLILLEPATIQVFRTDTPSQVGGLISYSQTTFGLLRGGWTEPLLALNFSLAMFCAIRWRKALPYALGLFFATKQYTVLAVPAVWLLMDQPGRRRQYILTLVKAGLVAAAVTLPFLLWNPHEFWRAIVQWQLVQPFRKDALSYLVLIAEKFHGYHMPIWTPLAVVIPLTALALWRCPRTPAGFATAMTLIYMSFFAMNKQAFLNYYFFVIVLACWSIAASARPSPLPSPRVLGEGVR